MSLKEICRTCLRSARILFPIFDSTITIVGIDPILVSDMLKVFNIQISHKGGFPYQICTDCLNEIQRAYYFKLKCQRSEVILNQLKGVKIKLKKFKNFPIKREYDDDKTCEPYKELKLSISQIKNEISECVVIKDEYEKGSSDWTKPETRIDSPLDNDSILNGCEILSAKPIQLQHDNLPTDVLDTMKCTYNVTQKVESVIQDIKQEPELEIVMNEADFDQVFTELNESENQSIADIFRCPGCAWKSFNIKALNEHVIGNHIEMQFCKICNEEFECTAIQHCSKHVDEMHSSTTSTNKNNENCQISLLETDFGGDAKGKSFKCEVCCETISNRDRNFHMTTKHSVEQNAFQCSMCLKRFQFKSNFEAHVLRLHGYQYKCHICSQIFRNKTALKIHFAVIHADDLDAPKVLPEDGKYCKICSKNFMNRSNLIAHMRMHTREEPFRCEICLQTFRYQKSVTRHMKNKHDPIQCSMCSKSFQYLSKLKAHMRFHEINKYQCHICLQIFESKIDLKTHWTMKHVNDVMTIHIDNTITQSIHENVKRCEICLETFQTKSHLMRHLQTFQCANNINTRLAEKNAAEDATKNGEKNEMRCGVCSAFFTCESNLNLHLKSHSKKKLFKCETCSEFFQYRITFQNHMKTKHGLEHHS